MNKKNIYSVLEVQKREKLFLARESRKLLKRRLLSPSLGFEKQMIFKGKKYE